MPGSLRWCSLLPGVTCLLGFFPLPSSHPLALLLPAAAPSLQDSLAAMLAKKGVPYTDFKGASAVFDKAVEEESVCGSVPAGALMLDAAHQAVEGANGIVLQSTAEGVISAFSSYMRAVQARYSRLMRECEAWAGQEGRAWDGLGWRGSWPRARQHSYSTSHPTIHSFLMLPSQAQ